MRLRRTAVVAAITMLGAGTGAAVVAGPGGAQVAIDNQAHLTVNKAVVGTPPDGTQYTVGISCSQNGGPPTTSAVIMSGPGNVADADYLLDGPVVCTVTESATGGATASFACTATDNAQCSGNVVTFNSGGATGTITVTNTFADPITVEVAGEVVQRAPTAIVATHRTAGRRDSPRPAHRSPGRGGCSVDSTVDDRDRRLPRGERTERRVRARTTRHRAPPGRRSRPTRRL